MGLFQFKDVLEKDGEEDIEIKLIDDERLVKVLNYKRVEFRSWLVFIQLIILIII